MGLVGMVGMVGFVGIVGMMGMMGILGTMGKGISFGLLASFRSLAGRRPTRGGCLVGLVRRGR